VFVGDHGPTLVTGLCNSKYHLYTTIRAPKGATSACHVVKKNLGRRSGHERPAACRGVPTDPPSPAPPDRLLAGPPRTLVVAASRRGRRGRAAMHLRLRQPAAAGSQRGGARGAETPRARRPHLPPRREGQRHAGRPRRRGAPSYPSGRRGGERRRSRRNVELNAR